MNDDKKKTEANVLNGSSNFIESLDIYIKSAADMDHRSL